MSYKCDLCCEIIERYLLPCGGGCPRVFHRNCSGLGRTARESFGRFMGLIWYCEKCSVPVNDLPKIKIDKHPTVRVVSMIPKLQKKQYSIGEPFEKSVLAGESMEVVAAVTSDFINGLPFSSLECDTQFVDKSAVNLPPVTKHLEDILKNRDLNKDGYVQEKMEKQDAKQSRKKVRFSMQVIEREICREAKQKFLASLLEADIIAQETPVVVLKENETIESDSPKTSLLLNKVSSDHAFGTAEHSPVPSEDCNSTAENIIAQDKILDEDDESKHYFHYYINFRNPDDR